MQVTIPDRIIIRNPKDRKHQERWRRLKHTRGTGHKPLFCHRNTPGFLTVDQIRTRADEIGYEVLFLWSKS